MYTGADCVPGLYGHGKTSIFATVANCKEAHKILEPLGSHIEVSKDLIVDLQLFTHGFLYSGVRSDTMGQSRTTKWNGMKKKVTSRIPPDSDSLLHHIESGF